MILSYETICILFNRYEKFGLSLRKINNYIIKGLYASDSKFKWLKEKIAQNDARQV